MVWIIGGGIYFVLLGLSLAFLRGVSILDVENERGVFRAISDKRSKPKPLNIKGPMIKKKLEEVQWSVRKGNYISKRNLPATTTNTGQKINM